MVPLRSNSAESLKPQTEFARDPAQFRPAKLLGEEQPLRTERTKLILRTKAGGVGARLD